ncbi:MAG: hypothetical protein M1837_006825 [Sclerophora amabilis]|nr:MAG: hypothetical protein M1837_006825 [Sclerophora amabilis]
MARRKYYNFRPCPIDESTILVKANCRAPDSLRAFIDQGPVDMAHNRPGEPPRKRQRVGSGESIDRVPPSSDPSANFVTIGKKNLDLVFSGSSVDEECPINWDECQKYSVVFKALYPIGPSLCQLVLTKPGGKSLLDLHVESETLHANAYQYHHLLVQPKQIKKGDDHADVGIVHTQATLSVAGGSAEGYMRIQTRLNWRTTDSYVDLPPTVWGSYEALFNTAFPETQPDESDFWSPQMFYNSVHVPEKDQTLSSAINTSLLRCKLYPFQQRAIRWLMQREGVDFDNTGKLRAYRSPPVEIPSSFYRTVDKDGTMCYVSHLFKSIATNLEGFQSQNEEISGGILSEEMGLGKTVELIALICLHKRDSVSRDLILDRYINTSVRPSSATLIITPPAILQQWKNELKTHAPSLKVLDYEGLSKLPGDLNNDDLVQELCDYDIVLTTYTVLSHEIHYAAPKPERSLRHSKKYEARRSPLVQISWWRVCLDEAQMVESGVSNSATVACLIPRCNAWAVTGTPVRKDASDLLGLLVFLRYEPYCRAPKLWRKLLHTYEDTFKSIFGQIALRHTKDQVRHELQLPPQKRIVITIPFTQIEEQNYAQLYQQMCEDCGVDREGAPAVEDWDPKDSKLLWKMQTWLTRLRQSCLHPEVGLRNRRALGRPAGGVLRTVGEVLEVMIEQNETSIRSEERAYFLAKIRRGQVLESRRQSVQALETWTEVLEESRPRVKQCRARLERELEKIIANKKSGEGPLSRGDDKRSPSPTREEDSMIGSASDGVSDNEDSADLQDKSGKIIIYRQRLRNELEVEHIATFFAANANFQIKTNEELTKPDSEDFQRLETAEREAYERAKLIRKELLSEIRRKVGKLMRQLSRAAETQSFVEISEITTLKQPGGIETRKVAERLELLGAALNEQANQLDDWRETMVQLLLQKLVDEDEGTEIQGDEYETSTKQQEEVYVYMETIRAVVADRHGALTGQENGLIAKDMELALTKANKGEGPHPELLKSLLSVRAQIKPPQELGSLRDIVSSLRSLSGSLRWQEGEGSSRARSELSIVEIMLKQVQEISTEQTRAVTGLDREVDLFRLTMNTRLEYYKQLQQISDTVAAYEEDANDDDGTVMKKLLANEEKLQGRISSQKSKGRYLVHLRTESSEQGGQRLCIICQTSFEIGALTVCGHQYCKDCIRMWWRQHRSCPICKKLLNLNDLHQITYKPQELHVQEEEEESIRKGDLGTSCPTSAFYSGINDKTLNEIKNIDVDGSFGTKIDTLARHLFWIRDKDPGAKSIIFSQYREFLDVLGRAFNQFRIGFSSIDSKGGIEKFRNDPGTECFLLHAKAHSSGLNLVNATHVFLSEPLINTALELQAIARVHRIGQHRPTTIWMYLISDTVEESIYDISVSRRFAHMSKALRPDLGRTTPTLKESTIDAANSLELQQAPLANLLAKTQAGGETVKNEDLWNCLFRKGRSGGTSREQAADMDPEVGRYLRADAAEARRDGGDLTVLVD